MFVLQRNLVFWWPVTVMVPSEQKPGEFEKNEFQVQFENIDRDEARKIRDELLQLQGAEFEKREDDLMRRVTKGWKDVVDLDGKTSVPFTPETFAAFWQVSWNRIGLMNAWNESIGGQKARLGN